MEYLINNIKSSLNSYHWNPKYLSIPSYDFRHAAALSITVFNNKKKHDKWFSEKSPACCGHCICIHCDEWKNDESVSNFLFCIFFRLTGIVIYFVHIAASNTFIKVVSVHIIILSISMQELISHGETLSTCRCSFNLFIHGNTTYHQTSDIRRTSVGNKIVSHSDVVGKSPVGVALTTTPFST